KDTVKLRFSPDGKTLAVCCAGANPPGPVPTKVAGAAPGPAGATMTFWDTETWRETGRVQAGAATIGTFTYSPDGSLIALADNRGTVAFWDAATRKRLGEVKAHPVNVSNLAFGADGKTLVTATPNPQEPAKLWELLTDGANVPWRFGPILQA